MLLVQVTSPSIQEFPHLSVYESTRETCQMQIPSSNLRESFQGLKLGLRICHGAAHTLNLVLGVSEEGCNKWGCLRGGTMIIVRLR